jgi:uncharacterized protein YjaZ
MYKPNRRSFSAFEELKKAKIWDKTEMMFNKYQKKWNGPDLPIYIFPLEFGMISGTIKSGVSFKDKIFLFVAPLKDEKELEALLVHEYHHSCRIRKQKKEVEEYTLLDSIILEGLAENAVEECCGKNYLAKWSGYYSNKQILNSWNSVVKPNLECKINSRIHDEILYGKRMYPPMIGYSVGYKIIILFKKQYRISIEESFTIPSDRIAEAFPKENWI